MDKAVRGIDYMSGVALAEPPSSAPTLRMPTWRDLFAGPDSHLPDVITDAQPLLEIGTAVQLDVVGRIPVSNGPITGMVSSRDGRRLVVTNYGDDSVSVVDTASGAVAKTLTGIYEPFAIAAAGNGRVYLSAVSPAYDAIALLDVDAENLVAAYPQAGAVRDVVVSADSKKVYASCTGADGAEVALLDAATGEVEVITVTDAPDASADRLAISADGRRLYVAIEQAAGSALAVIDTAARRVAGSIQIGSPIRDIALSRDGSIAYIAACGPDTAAIDIIDTRAQAVTGRIDLGSIGGGLAQLSLSLDGERAYLVTDSGITVFSTLTHDIVGLLALPAQPSCLVESVDGGHLYVADYAGTLTVVSIAWTAASLVGEVSEAMARAGLMELEPALV